MDNKEKIKREKKMMEVWEELKPHKQSLVDLLLNNRKFEPLDYILLFQCVKIVLEYLELQEQELKNVSGLISVKEEEQKINSPSENILNKTHMNISKELIEYLSIISDKNCSLGQRFEAIEKIKISSWKYIYNKKEEIFNLINEYTGKLSDQEIRLIFRCMTVVLMELDIQEQEIEILEQLYNN